jgi:hypothetical protein
MELLTEREIIAINIGVGEFSSYYEVGKIPEDWGIAVGSIELVELYMGKGLYNDLTQRVYEVRDDDGNLQISIYPGTGVIVHYG